MNQDQLKDGQRFRLNTGWRRNPFGAYTVPVYNPKKGDPLGDFKSDLVVTLTEDQERA